MSNDFNSKSRSGYRAKRKKTNLVLNSLIVIVLLLIIIVAYNIFASGSDKASPKKESPKTEQKETVNKEKEKLAKADQQKTTTKDNTSDDNATKEDNQESQEVSTPATADESQAVVSDGGSSSNVVKTIENPSWKPVGTTQTGEHTPVYDGVDWDEMLHAISYATGLEQSNMKVYWLGSDKSTTNAAVGTVYSADQQQKYKVFIKWVDGEGWMPTKVEELAQLEK